MFPEQPNLRDWTYNVKSISIKREPVRGSEGQHPWNGFYMLTGGEDDLTASCTMQGMVKKLLA